ncbi:MAG: hypothetical protein ABI851_15945 [Saprospiraceae bacterium]
MKKLSYILLSVKKVVTGKFGAFLLLISCNMDLICQEPFDVPCIDFPIIQKIDYTSTFIGSIVDVQSSSISKPALNFQPFNQQNVGMTITNSLLIPNININLIQYRLGLFSFKSKKDRKYINSEDFKYKKDDVIRIYLPLIIISKFNTNYDSTNIATVSDMTGFNGSPLTMRLMPSYTVPIGLENSITFGQTSDLRTIIYKDKISGKMKPDFGYYGSIGIKFAGRGEVRDEFGTSYEGNWSFSALLYAFIIDSRIQNQISQFNENIPMGLESIFKFKLVETKITKFNLYGSAQYQFEHEENVSPFILKLGIGN